MMLLPDLVFLWSVRILTYVNEFGDLRNDFCVGTDSIMNFVAETKPYCDTDIFYGAKTHRTRRNDVHFENGNKTECICGSNLIRNGRSGGNVLNTFSFAYFDLLLIRTNTNFCPHRSSCGCQFTMVDISSLFSSHDFQSHYFSLFLFLSFFI